MFWCMAITDEDFLFDHVPFPFFAKYRMNDAYVAAFREVVQSTRDRTGYTLPEEIEAYVVMLLADHMEKPDFLPERSFAESYLKLENSSRYSPKELGDTCLFVTGVFPHYGRKYGLDRTYYSSIGISSYAQVAETLHFDLFSRLSTRFEAISEFIEVSVTPPHSTKFLSDSVLVRHL